MSDIILLNQVGIKVVLVHGGGPEITGTMQAMGIESKFINLGYVIPARKQLK